MRSIFYLYASGEEKDIRSLNSFLNIADSDVKKLRLNRASSDSGKEVALWRWRTPYQECKGAYPEDELLAFLEANSDLTRKLAERRDYLEDVTGIIICQINEKEQPKGYSISSRLIELLRNMGASLEIEIEPALN